MPKAVSEANALVLADLPERQQLTQLQASIEATGNAIANAELELNALRDSIVTFDASYKARMRRKHFQLQRVTGVLRHAERWMDLLEKACLEAIATQTLFGENWNLLQRRRRHELQRHRQARHQQPARETTADLGAPPHTAPRGAQPGRQEQLKALYRALARRFHPDLAETEEQRLRHSRTMAQINTLYGLGDFEKLQGLQERSRGADIDTADLSMAEQVQLLQKRSTWFCSVLKSLLEERSAIEASSTYKLWHAVEDAKAVGNDLLDKLDSDLEAHVRSAYENIPRTLRRLEALVNRYNKVLSPTRDIGALEKYFDPYADNPLTRLALQDLDRQRVSVKARRRVTWLQELLPEQRGLLHLLLFAHIADLSALPLLGLETYQDLADRFSALACPPGHTISLEEALVQADGLVEFGVRRSTGSLVHVGLRFRSQDLRDAVPLALDDSAIRHEFKKILSVLGDHTDCPQCHDKIFAVPLYRTRGLDDLRASVCPRCGATLHSYWMPRGKDVQAVLNAAFVDHEIVHEFSFMLATASIAMQIVPQQLNSLRVLDLKKRLLADVFARHSMALESEHLELWQQQTPVSERRRLCNLSSTAFVIQFSSLAKMSEADALEILRHRIRTQFA